MKTNAIFLLTAALAAGCSSTAATNQPVENGAGGGGGQSSAGAAGTGNAAGATAIAGSSGTPSGGAASAGAAGSAGAVSSGGAGGVAGAGGAGGVAGAGGAAAGIAGASGAGGSAGSVPVGNLPSQIPAGYKGTPFGGMAQQIPGKIEVERYDLGGVGVAFNAMTGGAFSACGFARTDAVALECTGQPGPQDQDFATCMNYPAGSVYIGYIGGGNWYKYTVDVLEAGSYVISGHEGVSPTNAQVSFDFTADSKADNVALPSTNGKCTSEAYHVWGTQDALAQIDLVPGHYVLTLTVVNAGLNMDWFAFTKK
jgi:hypothetical protein